MASGPTPPPEPRDRATEMYETAHAVIDDALRRTIRWYAEQFPTMEPNWAVMVEAGGASTIMHSYAKDDHTPDVQAVQAALGVAAVQAQMDYGGYPVDVFDFRNAPAMEDFRRHGPDEQDEAIRRWFAGAAVGSMVVFQRKVQRLAIDAIEAGDHDRAVRMLRTVVEGGEAMHWLEREVRDQP